MTVYSITLILGNRKVLVYGKYFKNIDNCNEVFHGLYKYIDSILNSKFYISREYFHKVLDFVIKQNKGCGSLYNIIQKPFQNPKYKEFLKDMECYSNMVFDGVEFKIKFPEYDTTKFMQDLLCYMMSILPPQKIVIESHTITQDDDFLTIQKNSEISQEEF